MLTITTVGIAYVAMYNAVYYSEYKNVHYEECRLIVSNLTCQCILFMCVCACGACVRVCVRACVRASVCSYYSNEMVYT